MRNIIIIILSVLATSILYSSCSNSEKEHTYVELSELDFGKGTYRPNPFKFLDNFPPFSWIGMPDSVKKETELEFSFNEDAIRSHSSGQLAFIDLNGNKVNGIVLEDSIPDKISFDATKKTAVIPVSFIVNPEVGDSILRGSIAVIGNDLDQVNDTKLSSMATPIATWTLTHEIGINWFRWAILIIMIAIALYLLYLLGCIIYGAVATARASLSLISLSSIFHKRREDNIIEKRRKKRKNNRNRNPFIVHCERILLSSNASLSDKATTLERLFTFWDYELPESDKDFEASMLEPRVLEAMEELWDKYYRYTKKRMKWSGEPLDSMLIPNPETTPLNRNYSNLDNLTWGEIMKKYNYKGLIYHRGKPDFSNLAIQTIQIPNFDSFVNSFNDSERGPLQEEAFSILAKKLNKSIEEVRLDKEKNRLVWHEDTDCKTLYLVPQEIHNNLNHFGGIGMLKILRKSGLF